MARLKRKKKRVAGHVRLMIFTAGEYVQNKVTCALIGKLMTSGKHAIQCSYSYCQQLVVCMRKSLWSHVHKGPAPSPKHAQSMSNILPCMILHTNHCAYETRVPYRQDLYPQIMHKVLNVVLGMGRNDICAHPFPQTASTYM